MSHKLILALATSTILIFARPGNAQQAPESIKKRGSFSLAVMGGIEQLRVTNEDGKLVGYQGTAKGLSIGLTPFDDWMPGFGFYATILQSDGENRSESGESFTSTQYEFGLNQYLVSWLFIYGGYRSQNLSFSNFTTEESKTSLKGFAGGFGIEPLRVGQAWSLAILINAHYGYSPKGEKQNYNVGSDSIEYLIGIRWTPTVSFSMGKN